jgi:hypothetical protein
VTTMVPDTEGCIEAPMALDLGVDIEEVESPRHVFQFRSSQARPLDDLFSYKFTYLDRGTN